MLATNVSAWCPMSMHRQSVAAALALTAVALGACTGQVDEGSAEPSAEPVTESVGQDADSAPPQQAATWSLDGVRVDRLPRDLAYARSDLPRRFPADNAALPDLLADPPDRAVLAYHPREFFEPGGWASERIFFLGTDGGWRSLAMADLGLPESAWPGVDSYGPGALSYDGRIWAGRTNFGVVLVDLSSGEAMTVETPGVHTSFLAWRPDGQQLDMVRRGDKDRSYRTWSLNPRTGKVVRARYRLPLSAYAPDGTVVTFTKDEGGTQRVIHYPDGKTSSEAVSVPYRRVRNGALVGSTNTVIGLYRTVAVVDNATTSPIARLGAPFSSTIAQGWLDANRVLLTLDPVGLVAWNVATGKVQALTKVRPAVQPDSWWSLSVALDLIA